MNPPVLSCLTIFGLLHGINPQLTSELTSQFHQKWSRKLNARLTHVNPFHASSSRQRCVTLSPLFPSFPSLPGKGLSAFLAPTRMRHVEDFLVLFPFLHPAADSYEYSSRNSFNFHPRMLLLRSERGWLEAEKGKENVFLVYLPAITRHLWSARSEFCLWARPRLVLVTVSLSGALRA